MKTNVISRPTLQISRLIACLNLNVHIHSKCFNDHVYNP